MNSAKGSAQIRRNAIILNTPGAHPKDAEKGRRVITKRFLKAPKRMLEIKVNESATLPDPGPDLMDMSYSRDRAGLPKPMTK